MRIDFNAMNSYLPDKKILKGIEKIRSFIHDKLPRDRVGHTKTDVLSMKQKESLEKRLNDLIGRETGKKQKREKQQIGLYEKYLDELRKIPSYKTTEEIKLGDKIRNSDNDLVAEKILIVNKKDLLPIIAACVDSKNADDYLTGPEIILRREKNHGKDMAMGNNPYFTRLELILMGEMSLISSVISWAKVEDKIENFSSYVKNNEKFIRSDIVKFIDGCLDDIHRSQERLAYDLTGKEELKNTALRNVVISLKRPMCLGTYPAYGITISGNGEVIYDGKAHVKIKGKKSGKIPAEKINGLIAGFEKYDFFSLQDRYERHATDLPSFIISIEVDGMVKRIKSDLGVFHGLDELAETIDKIADSSKWIK
jgi:hypothetical protein